MKRIKWKWFKHTQAMTLSFGIVLVRPDKIDDPVVINHERIHIAQVKRDGIIKYSLKYAYEAVTKGYRNVSYEIEAYQHENDFEYLK